MQKIKAKFLCVLVKVSTVFEPCFLGYKRQATSIQFPKLMRIFTCGPKTIYLRRNRLFLLFELYLGICEIDHFLGLKSDFFGFSPSVDKKGQKSQS